MKHSPGPWKISGFSTNENWTAISDANGYPVAEVVQRGDIALVLAASQLLEALKDANEALKFAGIEPSEASLDAINKAEGKNNE